MRSFQYIARSQTIFWEDCISVDTSTFGTSSFTWRVTREFGGTFTGWGLGIEPYCVVL